MFERFALGKEIVVGGLVAGASILINSQPVLVFHHFSFCL
jgi:hypothetical protein